MSAQAGFVEVDGGLFFRFLSGWALIFVSAC